MNIEKFGMEKKLFCCKKMWQQKHIFLVSILFKKLREEKAWGGGWLSERRRIFEKNIPGNGDMIYLILIAFFYPRSFWARKHFQPLVKYPHVLYFKPQKLCIYAYYDIRNLIETRGRGVKTIALPLDRQPSYEDNSGYGKVLCST